jgi:molybdopterin synthase sulfur carrier subunit
MDVIVYGPLRGATGAKRVEIEFEGETVRDALDAFVTAYPRAQRHLVRDTGALESSVRIAVDGEPADPDETCPADASLTVHPAMQGG